jgi:hypothetical protein
VERGSGRGGKGEIRLVENDVTRDEDSVGGEVETPILLADISDMCLLPYRRRIPYHTCAGILAFLATAAYRKLQQHIGRYGFNPPI